MGNNQSSKKLKEYTIVFVHKGQSIGISYWTDPHVTLGEFFFKSFARVLENDTSDMNLRYHLTQHYTHYVVQETHGVYNLQRDATLSIQGILGDGGKITFYTNNKQEDSRPSEF